MDFLSSICCEVISCETTYARTGSFDAFPIVWAICVDGLAPTPPHGNEDPNDAQDEVIDEAAAEERETILRQLEILHAKGILDDDEFNTKIQRLYGKDA